MANDRRDWERPYRQGSQGRDDEDRQRRGEERYGSSGRTEFGGYEQGQREQGQREGRSGGGLSEGGGAYETGGFQGGGGYPRREDEGFALGERGGYQRPQSDRGDFDRSRQEAGRQGGGYGRGDEASGRERDWRAVARERAGFLSDDDDGGLRGRGGERPGTARGGDYAGFGGDDHPSWGRSWGMEEQTGWRGPGEMPGYRTARTARPHFQQGSSGGQSAGEYRNWSPGSTQSGRGPHAGRGPRNYRRSDERILGELCDRLTADPDVDATDIDVQVTEARVVLSGEVPDRRTKHRAEDLADAVLGVVEVENRLRVRRGESDRPRVGVAPTAPSGHNTVLHADAPELIGAPTATGRGGERGGGEIRGKREERGSGSKRRDRQRGSEQSRDDSGRH